VWPPKHPITARKKPYQTWLPVAHQGTPHTLHASGMLQTSP
jgi:hypothetical protein